VTAESKTYEKTSSREPSIRATAFNCPHCGAFTTQFWCRAYAEGLGEKEPLPIIPTEQGIQDVLNDPGIKPEVRESLMNWAKKIQTGLVFFKDLNMGRSCYTEVENLHLSKCYNCHKIAVWIHDRLLFPAIKAGVVPNTDLPEEVLRDFNEAREIVNASPRGAAALLRLCVQKLCRALGEKGKNIGEDIAELVKKGLSPRVQQALDIVRVIGNEAVHPGELDLKDDRDTALRLFDLVNEITEQMITRPKAVAAMYEKLPEAKRKAIEARDAKKGGAPTKSEGSNG
jgi:Domain of unknown function (DUF4145)